MQTCETDKLERASTRSSDTSPGLLRVKAGREGWKGLALGLKKCVMQAVKQPPRSRSEGALHA
eukprot:1661652-Pleurochrysis_carterae.AAC.1